MKVTDEFQVPEADKRTFLKLLGGSAAVGAVGTGTVSAQEAIDAELEGPLEGVDEAAGTIDVMGIAVDVSDASMSSPTADLMIGDLAGDPFPGRGSTPGFLGGTAAPVGTTMDTGGVVTADTLFVEPAENVIVGAVTENTTETNGSNEDAINEGTFAVQDTVIRTAQDPRLPFSAVVEAGFTVDVSTVPEGSLAEVEGYYGDDGVLYAHTLVVEEGETDGQPSTSITRAECDDDDGELEVRGESSTPDGSISVYDHNTDELLGTTAIEQGDGSTGEFRLRANVEECPTVVRAENSNGSRDVSDVEVD
ncbi:hypothetical protein [Halorarum salinum]|uniref:Uncharacterized protein n=1 Tax=Halorarum salinum TaxID=2743089 RepID=A0A7D5L9T3_9EURY|nr:hypothetical protein [Halobaculum salinum]QLG61330.1 hypothetical protein HUG12_06105 [Halobaculum salinum]